MHSTCDCALAANRHETRKFHKYPESCRAKAIFVTLIALITLFANARLYDSISCLKCAKNTHLACRHKRNLSQIAFQFVINCANGRHTAHVIASVACRKQPPCLPWVPIERHTCTHSNMCCIRTHSCRRRRRRRSRVAYNNYNIYSNRMPYWRLSRLCCCSHNTHQQSGAVLKCAGILNSNKH